MTKNRPEDQHLPKPNDFAYVQPLIIKDIEERTELGMKRYGVPGLQPFNGRDVMRDVYEEVLDTLVYLRAVRSALEASRAQLIEVATEAITAAPPRWLERSLARNLATTVVNAFIDAGAIVVQQEVEA